MELVTLAALVCAYINSIRALEDECSIGDMDYLEHPLWDAKSDNLEELLESTARAEGVDFQKVMDSAGIVWEAGYCDYVSEEECLEALCDKV